MISQNLNLHKFLTALPILATTWFLSLGTAQITASSGISTSDPGPRGGPPAAGGPIAGLNNTPGLLNAFNTGSANFQEEEDVTNDGLGPRFNSNSCVSCHSQPAVGGSSPAANPQIIVCEFAKPASVFHYSERTGSRGALYQETRWQPRRWRSRHFYDRGPRRPARRMQSDTGGLLESFKYYLSHSHADFRTGFDRGHH